MRLRPRGKDRGQNGLETTPSMKKCSRTDSKAETWRIWCKLFRTLWTGWSIISCMYGRLSIGQRSATIGSLVVGVNVRRKGSDCLTSARIHGHLTRGAKAGGSRRTGSARLRHERDVDATAQRNRFEDRQRCQTKDFDVWGGVGRTSQRLSNTVTEGSCAIRLLEALRWMKNEQEIRKGRRLPDSTRQQFGFDLSRRHDRGGIHSLVPEIRHRNCSPTAGGVAKGLHQVDKNTVAHVGPRHIR